MLKFIKITSKLGYWLLGITLIYVVSLRLLMPQINYYREDIERQISQILGLTVRIEQLDGGLIGFKPFVTGHNVTIDGFTIPQLNVILSLGSSIVKRDLQLNAITVIGLELEAEQHQDESWHILNLPQLPQNNESDLNVAQALDNLRKLGDVTLRNAKIKIKPYQLSAVNLEQVNITASTTHALGIIHISNHLPIAFKANFNLNSANLLKSSVEAYAEIPTMDIMQFDLPNQLDFIHLAELKAGAQVWLNIAQGALRQAKIKANAKVIELAPQGVKTKLENISFAAYVRAKKNGMDIQVDDFSFDFAQKAFPKLQLKASQHDEIWRITADQIDVEPLFNLAPKLASLPQEAHEFFEHLSPYGILRNVQLSFNPQENIFSQIHIDAEVEKAGVNPYWHIPGSSNVTGSVHGSLANGELRLDTQDFGLHLAQFFPHKWFHTTAKGRLAWQVDANKMRLALPYAQVEGDEGLLFGDMMLQIGFKQDYDDFLDLRIGLREGDASFTPLFLPTKIAAFDQSLAKWLASAIKGGDVSEGFFQYQGSLHANDPMVARKIDLFFDATKAHLAYWEQWPDLNNGTAQIFIENEQVKIVANSAVVQNAQIRNTTAQMFYEGDKKIPHLQVKGDIKGEASDALRILQTAPIATKEALAGWQGKGAIVGKLELDIPFAGINVPRVQVEFNVNNASLNLPNPKLAISEITGNFKFDSKYGLSSPKISAQALNSQVTGKVTASNSQDKMPFSRFELEGKINAQEVISWLDLPLKKRVSGNFIYDLIITINDKSNEIRVDTDLAGVTFDLPPPFAKKPNAKQESSVRVNFDANNLYVRGNYADKTKFAVHFPKFNTQDFRAEVIVGEGKNNPSIPNKHGLQIKGTLAEFNSEQWLELFDSENKKNKTSAQTPNLNINWLLPSSVLIKEFIVQDQIIKNLTVSSQSIHNKSRINLNSEKVKGLIVLDNIITVDFSHLDLTLPISTSNEENKTDPLTAVDFTQIPLLNLNIDSLYVNSEHLGNISFELAKDTNTLDFNNITSNIKGLNIDGNMLWQKLATNNKQTSSFKGQISGKDLGNVLRNFNYTPSLTSKNFNFQLDTSWSGSPANLNASNLTGIISVDIKNGQLLEVDGSAETLRIFGLFNFNSLSRRLRLDFSDIFSKGLSFDKIKGELAVNDGVYTAFEPIALTGVSSNLEMQGSVNLAQNKIDANLQVAMPLTSNLPLTALIAGFSPAVGGALFVVDKVMGKKIAKFASINYLVSGDLNDPQFKLTSKAKK